ncbi:MAG TPA: hypothetical protein VLJ21_02035 [Candidatus Binatia bacterium]|nr:hypothetical protein [Candidatus Binatia bacterium]
MDDDRRKQLRRDMDSYLSQRKKGGWSLFKKSEPALHPTVQPYKKEEPKVEQLQPMEQEYESQSKKGWFSGFMNKLFGEETQEMPVEESMPVSDTSADLKELARIALQVMKQMPGDQIRDFKETPDYEKFKNILRKHKLIK